jgi:hypothetical protein
MQFTTFLTQFIGILLQFGATVALPTPTDTPTPTSTTTLVGIAAQTTGLSHHRLREPKADTNLQRGPACDSNYVCWLTPECLPVVEAYLEAQQHSPQETADYKKCTTVAV